MLQSNKLSIFFILIHVFLISVSNYLVQFPVEIMGMNTTWGAFSFPLIYVISDLTVRIFGINLARKVVFMSMFPAFLVSYIASTLVNGIPLSEFNVFSFRIALASLMAYLGGQVLDVFVFNKLRKVKQWWFAPCLSNFLGNILDTLLFFTIAFYQCSDLYMANNWVEIATVDYCFKLLIGLVVFLPIYGLLLRKLYSIVKSQKIFSDPVELL